MGWRQVAPHIDYDVHLANPRPLIQHFCSAYVVLWDMLGIIFSSRFFNVTTISSSYVAVHSKNMLQIRSVIFFQSTWSNVCDLHDLDAENSVQPRSRPSGVSTKSSLTHHSQYIHFSSSAIWMVLTILMLISTRFPIFGISSQKSHFFGTRPHGIVYKLTYNTRAPSTMQATSLCIS